MRICPSRMLMVMVMGLAASLAAPCAGREGGTPRSFIDNLAHMDFAKEQWQLEHPMYKLRVDQLVEAADSQLTARPFTIVNRGIVAPSGDQHDFVSYGFYWWPNPDTPNGEPWIRRDGFGNGANSGDFATVLSMSQTVRALANGYYFTEDPKYSEKAAEVLRTFFLDEATRMNPRNEYAHVIPGVSPGTFGVAGLGDAFRSLVDGAGLLEGSSAWTAEDEAGLKNWFRQFLEFMDTSPQARVQFGDQANHGTNFDMLDTLFSLYVEDESRAIRAYRNYLYDRMPLQIADDGSNPLEMERANNLHYHTYNLFRVMDVGALGEKLGAEDLFAFELPDGKNFRSSIDFIMPHYLAEDWPYWHDGNAFAYKPTQYWYLLRTAAAYLDDPELLDTMLAIRDAGYSVEVTLPREFVGSTVDGDLNGDRRLTSSDITTLDAGIRHGTTNRKLDLNDDGVVDTRDREYWISDLARTYVGDANLDGQFDASDLTQTLGWGHYEDNFARNSTWATGDWNGDMEFTSADFVVAIGQGGYENGPVANGPVANVPEPASRVMLAATLLGWPAVQQIRSRRRARNHRLNRISGVGGGRRLRRETLSV